MNVTEHNKSEVTVTHSIYYQITENFGSSSIEEGINLISTSQTRVISKELLAQLKYILEVWICSVLSYVGLVDNIVAIIVFAKMGFQDTMNISLTWIAFWDMLQCLTSALIRLESPIQLTSPALAVTWYSFTIIILGYLNSIATYASGAVAGFVAVERCLCVSMPFKVKILLPRKVVIVVDVLLSFGVVASYVLVYTRNTFDWMYSPTYNQTIAVIGHSSFSYDYPWTYDYIRTLSILYPLATFVLMCICTVIIVYHLRKASVTRATTTAKKHDARDLQVTVMLSVVISVYIVAYIPRLVLYLASILSSEFTIYGRRGNSVWLISYVMFVFALINSSVNPFILYLMSSQFRQTLRGMLRLK